MQRKWVTAFDRASLLNSFGFRQTNRKSSDTLKILWSSWYSN